MKTVTGDFNLTNDELRVVARYAVEAAEEVLPVFESAVPSDPRPRAALDAAWEFVNGAQRTKLQRVTSMDAHRAASEDPAKLRVLRHKLRGMPHPLRICTRSPRHTRLGTFCGRQRMPHA